MQWAIGIQPSPLPAMPFCYRSLEPCVAMGALCNRLNPASDPTKRNKRMVERSGTQSPKGTTTTLYEVVIYTMWNIWKEINRRTFQNTALQPRQVALLCKEDRTKPVGKWIRWPSRLVLVEFCGDFCFCTCGPGRLSGPSL